MPAHKRGRPPKYAEIGENIRKMIIDEKMPCNTPLPPERKLALRFECTQVTLRRALKYLEKKEVIYNIPHEGSFVGRTADKPRKKSNLAALIFPDDELFYYKIFSRLEPFFQENGKLLTVHLTGNSEEKEKKLLEQFSRMEFETVIAVPNPDCRKFYLEKKLPAVFFDAEPDGTAIPCIVSDDRSGAFQAVRHLINLGHRKIAFIGHNYDSSGQNRLNGYLDALAKSRLEVNPALIKLHQPTREWGINAMTEMFSKRDTRPSAVFCINDTVASGVMHYAHIRHIDIPQELSVASFGNTGIAEDLDLSSVDQNLDKIVDAIKFNVMQLNSNPPQKIENATIPCSLIVRSSCGICKEN
ncbi:MAG: GntR family transcriptional regulator [Lentisphaeria bacterium]|nr:GntR family transcriptional regulator [Lentisphaeria bacterium]